MTDSQPQQPSPETNDHLKWILVGLIMGVLLLASFALGRVGLEPSLQATTTETQLPATLTQTIPAGTGTPAEVNPDIPPQPHEVGYTDGIIFFATILVLILLVGTLREIVHRKGV